MEINILKPIKRLCFSAGTQFNKLLILFCMIYAHASYGGVAVIVNPAIGKVDVTEMQIANIFLGKTSDLPNNVKVIPVDQEEGEGARDEFYTKVVKKDASQLNAYWSRLIFTGKGQPPKALLDDDEVLEHVGNNKDAIGYISIDAVDDTVLVIKEIN